MLVVQDRREILKAILASPRHAHPRAAATLLEGLSLWHQCPLSVVVCADAEEHSSGLYLFDHLGFGRRTLHYEVELAVAHPRDRRSKRIEDDFGDLRQLWFEEVVR